MSSKACNSNAERLKTQGNELHQKGQYQAAHRKYTEAIKEDSTSAIYYANRAACSLALKEYLDAANDARKATELDPNYAKAWSRLGNANYELAAYTKSIDAWETALKCLPPQEQSTEAEKNLRVQFTAGLAKSQKARDAPPIEGIIFSRGTKMPWDRAAALEPELIAMKKISSAFVILHAYREYKEGVDAMKKLKRTLVNGNMQYVAKAGALADITNGVMRDPRVFHLDCSDWIEKFNEQVIFEANVYKAWVHGGAKTIKQEAPQRLKKEGWNHVRAALGTTIRAWLMCGLLANTTRKYTTAMEYYTRIIDVLEWGARTWSNVPVEDRGVVFEKTFIRGAKRMKLSAMQACLVGNAAGVTRNELVEFARDIVAETDANPPSPTVELDVGFIASFWMYPKAEALSVIAWHYMQLGHAANDSEEAQAAFSQSAEFYIKAAECYPTDDEATLTFYKVALEAYWFSPEGKTLADTFAILTRIVIWLPEAMKIWAEAASHEERDAQIQQALEFAERCREALDDEKVSLNDLVRPKEMEKLCKWKGKFVYI